jgi:hypothetical protein
MAPPDESGVVLRWWTQEGLASNRVYGAGATAGRRAGQGGGG